MRSGETGRAWRTFRCFRTARARARRTESEGVPRAADSPRSAPPARGTRNQEPSSARRDRRTPEAEGQSRFRPLPTSGRPAELHRRVAPPGPTLQRVQIRAPRSTREGRQPTYEPDAPRRRDALRPRLPRGRWDGRTSARHGGPSASLKRPSARSRHVQAPRSPRAGPATRTPPRASRRRRAGAPARA